MSDISIPQFVRPARHGSKQGWVPVTGEVPLATRDELDALGGRLGRYRSDLVYEAVQLLIERHAEGQAHDRRQGDRRAS